MLKATDCSELLLGSDVRVVTTLSLSPEELVELGIPEEKAIPTVLLSTRPKK